MAIAEGGKSFMEELEQLEVKLLLEAVYQLTSYDFREYSSASITRRIQNRKMIEQFSSITMLTNAIIHDEQMRKQLMDDFTIHVTEMFRDPSFFKCLREFILPQFTNLPSIKIWHAGCSTGEEVFSMAILLHELGMLDRATIFATDINEKILHKATIARFPLHKMQMYTRNYLASGGTNSFSDYYDTDDSFAYIKPALLQRIHFAQHNLVTDQSFNEFHIIFCRNVLIYFNPALQTKVHQLFFDSLQNGGFLALGNKETMTFSAKSHRFLNDYAHEHIFQKNV